MSKLIPELLTKAISCAGSQAELARIMGESPTTISDWKHERRTVGNARIAELARIAGEDEGEWIARIAIEKTGNEKACRWFESLTTSPAGQSLCALLGACVYYVKLKRRRYSYSF